MDESDESSEDDSQDVNEADLMLAASLLGGSAPPADHGRPVERSLHDTSSTTQPSSTRCRVIVPPPSWA